MRSVSTRQKLKQSLFKQGRAALAAARPGAAAGYRCPLCLVDFPTPEALTLEHAPPESLGGRERCLTCGPCNRFGGRKLEPALAEAQRQYDSDKGLAPYHVRGTTRLRLAGCLINVRMIADKEQSTFIIPYEMNRPDVHEAFKDQLLALAGGGNVIDQNVQATIDLKTPEIPRDLERSAILKTAYLIAFSELGYSYVLDRAFDIVRRQIAHPEEPLIGMFGNGGPLNATGPIAEEGLWFITEPRDLPGIYVRFGHFGAVLPLPGHLTFYSEWRDRFPGEGKPRIRAAPPSWERPSQRLACVMDYWSHRRRRNFRWPRPR